MNLPHAAAVHVQGMVRPAAFVWQLASGLAWLEPSYLDADALPAPALHHFAGEVQDTTTGMVVYGDAGLALVFDADQVAGNADALPAEVAEDLARLQDRLAEAGTTWDAELARMTEELAEDLALLAVK